MGHYKPAAHITDDGRIHPLEEHLTDTARRSSVFANEFGASDWGRIAGLWHDLGKFSDGFQKRLRGENKRVDHSTAGAIHSMEKFNTRGRIFSYLIAGHHAGLPDWQTETSGRSALIQRLEMRQLLKDALDGSPPPEVLDQQFPGDRPQNWTDPALWIRMLFSCLVDADFLDTEAFFDPEKAVMRRAYRGLPDLLQDLNAYMEDKLSNAEKSLINLLRADILKICVKKSACGPAIFTLTVPTGGGKTLSSMAFALNHAVRFEKRRVIYVIPYTSIIEQTAGQFREIFGEDVVEHHSNIGADEDGDEMHRSRLAAENWDAPVIVTTSVQFFESLFANRTSRCRKLHNIVNSVVVLDEAQLLPPDFLNPILEVIKELNRTYGVTFVLSTATQPALAPYNTFDFKFKGLPETAEIMDDPESLHRFLKRVKVIPPSDFTPISFEELSAEIKRHDTALAIVNRRDDCRRLHELMPHGTIHLSALMCGAHRTKVIGDIKERLKNGVPTRVVSTQLVEAGVDIDFPVVYRAIAGLDSIAQAAGRCNREGKLMEGKLFVFIPPTDAPPGHLRQAARIGQRLLAGSHEDPFSRELFEQFFKELFWVKGDGLDRHGILKDLKPNGGLMISFSTAASKFRIIDEAGYPVIVRYGEESEMLRATLFKKGPERWLMRKLQRYIVNVRKDLLDKLLRSGEVEEPFKGVHVQSAIGRYDNSIGLVHGSEIEPDSLII